MEMISVSAYGIALEALGDRTLRMSEKQYRLHVRSRFIQVLRDVPYFEAVVERELRPLWQGLSPLAKDIYSFQDLSQASAYVRAVQRLATERMNCRANGEPVDWIEDAIHLSVMRSTLTIGDLEPVGFIRRDLSVAASTIGTGEVLQIAHTQEGEEDIAAVRLQDQPYAAFDDWDGLRRVAHTQLDEMIDGIQTDYIGATSTFINVRPSRLQQLSDSNMRGLIAFLWPEIGAPAIVQKDTRRRLLKDLGLDNIRRAKTRNR